MGYYLNTLVPRAREYRIFQATEHLFRSYAGDRVGTDISASSSFSAELEPELQGCRRAVAANVGCRMYVLSGRTESIAIMIPDRQRCDDIANVILQPTVMSLHALRPQQADTSTWKVQQLIR